VDEEDHWKLQESRNDERVTVRVTKTRDCWCAFSEKYREKGRHYGVVAAAVVIVVLGLG
jgi:hypothetical protein